MDGIKVYVANLGKYNEGELIGTWINLPVAKIDLDGILRDKVGIDEYYESYAIHDYESTICEIGEYTSLYDLNILANELRDLSDEQIDIVTEYISINGINNPIEIINLIAQVDNIDFNYYSEEFLHLDSSKEEKLAYTLCAENGVTSKLEKLGIDYYFDYHAYGEAEVINNAIELTEKGWFGDNYEIDLNKYSASEIRSEAELPDPLYNIKKLEEMLEDDYNNIDGIIGNNDKKVDYSLAGVEEKEKEVSQKRKEGDLAQELEK